MVNSKCTVPNIKGNSLLWRPYTLGENENYRFNHRFLRQFLRVPFSFVCVFVCFSWFALCFSRDLRLSSEKIVGRQIVVLSPPQQYLEVMAGSGVKKLEKGTGRTRIWSHLALLMWMGGIHVNFFVVALILAKLRSTWGIT